ncbi:cytochrome P450 [Labrenzia sp. EL_195]|nr:cytochrome P450 [Labrenzia sp. EL_195]
MSDGSNLEISADGIAALNSPDIDWWEMFADDAFLASPYEKLSAIRERAPVQFDPVSGIYFVLGYPEYKKMALSTDMGRDTRLWSGGWYNPENKKTDPVGYELYNTIQPQMTNANAPHHRRMRDVYEKAFRRTDIQALLPMIEDECRKILDTLPFEQSFNFMQTVADPLSRNISKRIFNIPKSMDADLARWVDALSVIGNVIITPQQKQDALKALTEFRNYVRERMASGIDDPNDGFFGATIKAYSDGVMDEDECLNNLMTLISGGIATATLLGNGLLTLLRHPDQFELLRRNPELMETAIEEMLRFEPGCSFILRVAIDDYQCGDVLIPQGALAIGLVTAIGRDPRTYKDPDRFDVTRYPNPHVVFGVGAHICIGKALVRLTARVLFNALMDRFGRIELAGEPEWWKHRADQHGLDALPLTLGNA